jgi:Tfp pilus assembly protein PilN
VLSAQISGMLATDVSWSRMLQDIARTIPNDVWLTSFAGTVTPVTEAPATPPATAESPTTAAGATTTTTVAPVVASTLGGTVNFSAVGTDYPAVAAWLKMISELPSLSDLWTPNINETQLGGQNVVDFSSTANLTPAARSDRLQRYTEDTKR